jgi:hypothetical protein
MTGEPPHVAEIRAHPNASSDGGASQVGPACAGTPPSPRQAAAPRGRARAPPPRDPPLSPRGHRRAPRAPSPPCPVSAAPATAALRGRARHRRAPRPRPPPPRSAAEPTRLGRRHCRAPGHCAPSPPRPSPPRGVAVVPVAAARRRCRARRCRARHRRALPRFSGPPRPAAAATCRRWPRRARRRCIAAACRRWPSSYPPPSPRRRGLPLLAAPPRPADASRHPARRRRGDPLTAGAASLGLPGGSEALLQLGGAACGLCGLRWGLRGLRNAECCFGWHYDHSMLDFGRSEIVIRLRVAATVTNRSRQTSGASR